RGVDELPLPEGEGWGEGPRPPKAANSTVAGRTDLEEIAKEHAIGTVVYDHFTTTRKIREELVMKTMAAVKDRLTKEITFWDHRAEELKLQELAGRTPRLNSGNARRRAEDLESRL